MRGCWVFFLMSQTRLIEQRQCSNSLNVTQYTSHGVHIHSTRVIRAEHMAVPCYNTSLSAASCFLFTAEDISLAHNAFACWRSIDDADNHYIGISMVNQNCSVRQLRRKSFRFQVWVKRSNLWFEIQPLRHTFPVAITQPTYNETSGPTFCCTLQ